MDKFVTKEHISWKEEIMCAIWCTMSNDRHNFVYNCSHISVVWLQELNSLQWWLMTSPNLTNVVWVKTILYSLIQAHSAKKGEIPDTRNTRWFWKKIGYGLGIAKNYRVGSGIGYPSGPAHDPWYVILGHYESYLTSAKRQITIVRLWTNCLPLHYTSLKF